MSIRKWTTEENAYLMEFAFRVPWADIAEIVDRSEEACKKQYEKIKKLRQFTGTWNAN